MKTTKAQVRQNEELFPDPSAADGYESLGRRGDVVSVIIPVFNTHEYLRECLDSVCNQTYSLLEIILIDDGSADGSSEICDEYAAKDSRIHVVHQINAGQSAARNVALDLAQGAYIIFVDSDDVIDAALIEMLHTVVVGAEADAALGGYSHSQDDVDRGVLPGLVETFTPKELLRSPHPLNPILTPNATGHLYARHLLSAIRFPVGRAHEDAMVTHRIIQGATLVAVTKHRGYYYRLRKDSITNSSRNSQYYLDKAVAHHLRAQDLSDLDAPRLVAVEFSKSLSYLLRATATRTRPPNAPKSSAKSELAHLGRLLFETEKSCQSRRVRLILFAYRIAPVLVSRIYVAALGSGGDPVTSGPRMQVREGRV